MFCRQGAKVSKRSRMISKFLAKGISETNITANSHQLFATPRLVKFTEIEYCIPLHYLKLALDEVRSCIEEKNHEVHFPIECRVVNADDIWLSPSYERESAYIAFHMFKGMPYESYFRDMEAIMRKYEGDHMGENAQFESKGFTKSLSKAFGLSHHS